MLRIVLGDVLSNSYKFCWSLCNTTVPDVTWYLNAASLPLCQKDLTPCCHPRNLCVTIHADESPKIPMHTPAEIRKFRSRCEKLFSQMCEQDRHGYLGQVEISCRMPVKIYQIEIKEIPLSNFEVSDEEGNQWHVNKFSRVSETRTSIAEMVDLCERIVYEIYAKTGYGVLTVKCLCSSPNKQYKFIFRWSFSYHQDCLIVSA